jgi:hypothetical protein
MALGGLQALSENSCTPRPGSDPRFFDEENALSVKPRDLPNPSGQIDKLIAEIADWRGKTFARVRKIIRAADPEIIEEFKWMGSPVWSRDGIIAVGNAFKGRVNITFAYGASLPDPEKLFNAGFEGNARRVINFFENDKINERALTNLVRAAIAYNQTNLKKNQKKTPAPSPTKAAPASPKKAPAAARALVTKKAPKKKATKK